MSLSIQDLLQAQVFPGLTLMAGSRGIQNEISWVNIMEIPDTPRSVQPGELLLTTGYGLEQEALYSDFLPELARRGVCGIAIQAGYYIDSIPAYILRQANELGFPVLQVPKTLTFSEFLHTMIRMMDPGIKLSWTADIVDKAFCLITADLPQTASVMEENSENCLVVMLLEPLNRSSAEESIWQKSYGEICSFLQSNSLFASFHELPGPRWAILTAHADPRAFHSVLYRLNLRLTLLSEDLGTNFFLGAEQLRQDEGVLPAITRAVESLNTLQLIHARRGVCFYDHIEFLKLVGQIHQRESSIVLENRHFQQLMEYDKTNSTNYAQTLRVYLANRCSMTETARQLFLHRHTLMKHLEKIEEISDMRLDDYYSRMYMSIALLLHDYFVY